MRRPPAEVTRFAYDLPAEHQLRSRSRQLLAVSPDGRRFVYNAYDGLYLRSMDELEARLLPGTELAGNRVGSTGAGSQLRTVFFSPDGRWVGYDEDEQLKRLAVSGGAPVSDLSNERRGRRSLGSGRYDFLCRPRRHSSRLRQRRRTRAGRSPSRRNATGCAVSPARRKYALVSEASLNVPGTTPGSLRSRSPRASARCC